MAERSAVVLEVPLEVPPSGRIASRPLWRGLLEGGRSSWMIMLLGAAMVSGCGLFGFAPRRIVLIEGDSIGNSWNAERHLRECDVRNRAVPGSTIGQLSARLPSVLRDQRPDRVVLFIGVNDVSQALADPAFARSGDRELLAAIAARYDALLRRLDSAGIPTLLIGPLPVDGPASIAPERQNDLHRAIDGRLARLLPSRHVDFLDARPLLGASSGAIDPFYTMDGIHLDGAGYDRIAPAVRDWISR